MCVSPLSLLRVALCVRFVAVRDTETRRARQQQQANANAAVEAALQAQQEETTRRADDYKGGSRNAKYYNSAVVPCTGVENSGIERMPVRVLKKKKRYASIPSEHPPVRGKNVKITTSLVLSSMQLCDFAPDSQQPTLLQPRPQGWLLGRGGLASSQVRKYSVVNSVRAVVECNVYCVHAVIECCTLGIKVPS